MTGLLYKNTLIKIKKSFGRYLSLLIIVMVGVGFFCGIRETSPDLILGVSQYEETYHLMDLKVVSTLGLTDDDVKALSKVEGVQSVTPTYSADVLDQGNAIKVQAIEDSVNGMALKSGRMPESEKECVADARHYKVGDTVKITSDVSDTLDYKSFKVVGTVESPLYMLDDYGNTTVGDGKLSSYIYVEKDAFDMEAYSEIYIQAELPKDVTAVSKKYDDLITSLKDRITEIKGTREEARYQEIYQKAADKIAENQKKLDKKEKEGRKKLSDAKKKLDDSADKLAAAKKKLAKSETDLNASVKKQQAAFDSAQTKIDQAWVKIDTSLDAYGISRSGVPSKLKELERTVETLNTQISSVSEGSAEYIQLQTQLAQVQSAYAGLQQVKASMDTLESQQAKLDTGISQFRSEIKKARAKLSDAKLVLAKNEKKLASAKKEYQKNKKEFEQKITDAQKKLDKAKKKLSDIETAKWYMYSRSLIPGYAELQSATDTITSISAILPIFFILIVLLMTSNTMARMIVEERNELGTMVSLGYSNGSIMFTYMLYVLSATIIGSVAGFFIGCSVIPRIIYTTFSQFILPPLTLRYDVMGLLLILAVFVALMSFVTWFFCNVELKQEPAALMRPVPPKHGQAIVLERVHFIWNRLSFTWKVTMRNIFRYKQRVLMTVIGVTGCMALLLAGFGLRDSINGVAEKQYGEIFRYQAMIALDDSVTELDQSLSTFLKQEKVTDPLLLHQTTFKAGPQSHQIDTYLITPENQDTFKKYFSLTSLLTEKGSVLSGDSVLISEKLSESLGIGKGGTIRITDADNKQYSLKVTDVVENYVQNYIYVGKTAYQAAFGEKADYNVIVADTSADKSVLAKQLLKDDLVVNVTFTSDILKKAADDNSSLNNVVVLLVVIAVMLAVIVLYNLTSINISERKREIATLKVLGFTDGEANQYIYREAMVLIFVSIVLGMVCGTIFHSVIISFIESDASVYFKSMKIWSYVWSALIIFAVSVIMQAVTYVKMREINMIESLKSVE